MATLNSRTPGQSTYSGANDFGAGARVGDAKAAGDAEGWPEAVLNQAIKIGDSNIANRSIDKDLH